MRARWIKTTQDYLLRKCTRSDWKLFVRNRNEISLKQILLCTTRYVEKYSTKLSIRESNVHKMRARVTILLFVNKTISCMIQTKKVSYYQWIGDQYLLFVNILWLSQIYKPSVSKSNNTKHNKFLWSFESKKSRISTNNCNFSFSFSPTNKLDF